MWMTSALARLRERPRRAALFASLLGLLTTAPALAEPQLELSWSAPPNCPQEAAVRQKLRAIWGEAQPKTQRLRAEGRIVRVGRHFRLTLALLDAGADRSRSIDADSCADLAGAAAVTLGLLLREDAAQSASARSANETAAATDKPADSTARDAAARDADSRERASNDRAAAAASDRQATAANNAQPPASIAARDEAARKAVSRRETASRTREWRILLRAPEIVLEWPLSEKPAFGGGGGAGLRVGAWRVGVTGRMFLNQTLWSKDFPDAGVRIHRSLFELWTCRGIGSGQFELAPCLTLGLDVSESRGVGADVNGRSVRGVSLVVGAAVAGRWYLSDWLALAATLGLDIETSRPRLVIRGLGQVDQRGPLVIAAALGPEWIF